MLMHYAIAIEMCEPNFQGEKKYEEAIVHAIDGYLFILS